MTTFVTLGALGRRGPAQASRAFKAQTNRPPTRHAGAGGNTQNARKASNTNDTTAASNASVALSLLLERHSVHVGLAQLEAGALVEAVRGLA